MKCAAVLLASVTALLAADASAQAHPDCRPGESLAACRERVCTNPSKQSECRRVTEEVRNREQERQHREHEGRKANEERNARARPPKPTPPSDKRHQDRNKSDAQPDEPEAEDRGSGGSAGTPDVLRPGTHPMFFSGAVGPNFFGVNRDVRFVDRTRARVSLDFGYHFSGDMEGPAIGANIDQVFAGDDIYVLNPTFKFWWDIKPVDDLGVYIAPFAKAGYAAMFCDDGPLNFCPGHAFNFGFGVEGRLVLGDRGLVLLRPLQFDNYMGDFLNESFWLDYSALIGGGVIF